MAVASQGSASRRPHAILFIVMNPDKSSGVCA
jgi:hypothetical protein